MDRTVSNISQEKLFKAILSLPENKYCADCRSLNPDWVSMTLGVFVCYKCSGTHRSFGSHITRVKSTTLDTWTLKQIYIMGTIDNVKANIFWEATIPKDFAKPNFDSSPNDLSSFARKKYVQKVFLARNTECPSDEVRKNLESAYENEEDKEAFFQNKLDELKESLKSKVSCLSPEAKNSAYKTPKFRTAKKATTLIIPETSFADAVRSATPGKKHPHNLFSPLKPINKRGVSNSFINDSQPTSQNTISSSQFPLFKGLKLRTQTNSIIIDESLETSMDSKALPSKAFTKSSTLRLDTWRFSGRSSYQPSTATSKNNCFELQSKPILLNYAEEDIYEESRGPTPRGSIEIEMKDLSNTSLHQEAEDSILGYKTGEDSNKGQQRKKSSKRSYDSLGLKLSDADRSEHLKRPGEAFEIPKSISLQTIPATRRFGESCWKYPVFLGSFILHLLIGYLYCWGSISPYIASFVMSDYQDDRYLEHASHNLMIFLGVAMGYCLCEKLANAVGMRVLVFGSFLGLGGTILLCSMTDDVLLYSGLLTIIPGFFIGLVYDVPYHCASQYFISQQIFLKGFFYLTNGIGAAAYVFFSYYYLSVTDGGAELNITTPLEVSTSSFYSDQLASHVPALLRNMSYIILAFGFIGTVLIQPRGSFIIRDWSGIREREEGLLVPTKGRLKRKATAVLRQGLKEALISPNTKALLFLMVWSFILSSFLLYSYKSIGLQQGYSDQFMTIVGGIGMISLGMGKLVGVVIHRRYEFKAMCKKMIQFQAFAGMALFLVSQTVSIAFLPIFLVIMFLDGVIFALVIEEIKFVYLEDVEDSIIALMMVGYAVANFLSFMIVKSLLVLQLKVAIILVLTLPLFLALKISKEYSRVTTGNDAEMISMLLAD